MVLIKGICVLWNRKKASAGSQPTSGSDTQFQWEKIKCYSKYPCKEDLKGKGTLRPEKIILNDTVECLQFKACLFYYMYIKEAKKTTSSKSIPFHSA